MYIQSDTLKQISTVLLHMILYVHRLLRSKSC